MAMCTQLATAPHPSPAASTKFVAVNKHFTINGTLRGSTFGVAGATIALQRSTNNVTWLNVTTTTTNGSGHYQFSRSESTGRIYYYRAAYDGSAAYASATSTAVSVIVVSKASVLADLNALSATINNLPASAFVPGTKTAALTTIAAAEISVGLGSYNGAATTLQTSLLSRTSGCAATGKPDSSDWIRTCAAQAQVYPQVVNVIQEIQALEGS